MGETSGRMKQFATWFTHGVPGGAHLRRAIYQERTGAAVLAKVDEFFLAQIAGIGDAVPDPEDETGEAYPEGASVCGL